MEQAVEFAAYANAVLFTALSTIAAAGVVRALIGRPYRMSVEHGGATSEVEASAT